MLPWDRQSEYWVFACFCSPCPMGINDSNAPKLYHLKEIVPLLDLFSFCECNFIFEVVNFNHATVSCGKREKKIQLLETNWNNCDCESNQFMCKLTEECISLSWSAERDLKTCVFSSCWKNLLLHFRHSPGYRSIFFSHFAYEVYNLYNLCSVLVRRVFITETFFFIQTNKFQTNPNFKTFSYFLLFLFFSILLFLTIFCDTWACSVCTDEWFIWSPYFIN